MIYFKIKIAGFDPVPGILDETDQETVDCERS